MRIPDPRLTNTRIKEWPFNSDQKLMVVQVAPTRLSVSRFDTGLFYYQVYRRRDIA